MKIRLNRDELLKAIDYHAADGFGVEPVLTDDTDLTEWTRYLLGKWTGYEDGELDGAGFGLAFDGEGVVLAGNVEIVEAVRSYVL